MRVEMAKGIRGRLIMQRWLIFMILTAMVLFANGCSHFVHPHFQHYLRTTAERDAYSRITDLLRHNRSRDAEPIYMTLSMTEQVHLYICARAFSSYRYNGLMKEAACKDKVSYIRELSCQDNDVYCMWLLDIIEDMSRKDKKEIADNKSLIDSIRASVKLIKCKEMIAIYERSIADIENAGE